MDMLDECSLEADVVYWLESILCRSICCSMISTQIFVDQLAAANNRLGNHRDGCFRVAWIKFHHVIQLLALCTLLHAPADDLSDKHRCNISRDRSHHIPSVWCHPLRRCRRKHNTCRVQIYLRSCRKNQWEERRTILYYFPWLLLVLTNDQWLFQGKRRATVKVIRFCTWKLTFFRAVRPSGQ